MPRSCAGALMCPLVCSRDNDMGGSQALYSVRLPRGMVVAYGTAYH